MEACKSMWEQSEYLICKTFSYYDQKHYSEIFNDISLFVNCLLQKVNTMILNHEGILKVIHV